MKAFRIGTHQILCQPDRTFTRQETLVVAFQLHQLGRDLTAAAYNVGEIFFSNQKIDDAIAYLELALKIKNDWAKAYHRLGLVYLNKGDLPKALENLKKFLEIDPQNPEAASVRVAIAAIEQIKK